MSDEILNLLLIERTKLDAAIEALHGASPAKRRGRPPATEAAAPSTPAEKKRELSAATRRKMAAGQKRRWEAKRAAVAESVAPIRKTDSVRIAEGVELKSKRSAAMKAAWAKRKKAGKRGST
jgi:hypothetical protein